MHCVHGTPPTLCLDFRVVSVTLQQCAMVADDGDDDGDGDGGCGGCDGGWYDGCSNS